MKINYDKTVDALYIYMKEDKVNKTIEINENMIVDINAEGSVVGIEILNASSQLSIKDLEKEVMTGIPLNFLSSTPLAA